VGNQTRGSRHVVSGWAATNTSIRLGLTPRASDRQSVIAKSTQESADSFDEVWTLYWVFPTEVGHAAVVRV
jgi:hypothetical protein